MTPQRISQEEAESLRAALVDRGEIRFPIGAITAGFLCGTIYKVQRSHKPYKPDIRGRLLARFSDAFASVLDFVLWIGPENVHVWNAPDPNSGKLQFCVRLKPNNSLKADALKGAA